MSRRINTGGLFTPDNENNSGSAGAGAFSVGTEQIKTGAITTSKIANKAVTAEKIAEGIIPDVHIGEGEITTSALADGAVTTQKLADESVIGSKIKNDSITSDHIKAKAITENKINDGAISFRTLGGDFFLGDRIVFLDSIYENGITITGNGSADILVNSSNIPITAKALVVNIKANFPEQIMDAYHTARVIVFSGGKLSINGAGEIEIHYIDPDMYFSDSGQYILRPIIEGSQIKVGLSVVDNYNNKQISISIDVIGYIEENAG